MDDTDTEDLVRRLVERFPDVGQAHVAAVVGRCRERLADRPIQDFTPVLVEHAAVDELRRGSLDVTGP